MPSSATLFLAPHLYLPPRNGADILVWNLVMSLSSHGHRCVMIAAQEVVECENGGIISRRSFKNNLRSRSAAAIRTLLRGGHYHHHRFLTKRYLREISPYLTGSDFDEIVYSYLTTALVLPQAAIPRHYVLTHNDEFKWFQDLTRRSKNPASKYIAGSSIRWLSTFLKKHPNLRLIHVTEEDGEGWAKHVPSNPGFVVPIGVAVSTDHIAPPIPPKNKIRLLFMGALGVAMNYDALAHFGENYWPILQGRFGPSIEIAVAGSSPTRDIKRLVSDYGWTLHPDLSDDAFDTLLASATFTLLPFAYATGAKLKLLKSLAHGIPVLATEAVAAQRDLIEPPSLLSSDPQAWANHIAEIHKRGISTSERDHILARAQEHSWMKSARLLDDIIQADRLEAL